VKGDTLHRAADLFPTLRILAALPESELAAKGAQICFPAGTALWWHGARKISHAALAKGIPFT
jgi:hypothetical protein